MHTQHYKEQRPVTLASDAANGPVHLAGSVSLPSQNPARALTRQGVSRNERSATPCDAILIPVAEVARGEDGPAVVP